MLSTVFSTPKYFFKYFGIPKVDATDNDSEYIVEKYKKLANEWCFILTNVTTRYPSNELVERTTETVMKELRKKCFKDENDPHLQ